MERENAFAGLKAEFTTKPKKRKTVDKAAIDTIAEREGFPSREAPARRTRRNITGRNQQINIKTTAEAIALFYEMADRKHVPLGKVFEDGLAALVAVGY